MRESRPEVLMHHVNLALQHSSLTMRTYATLVRGVYNQRTPSAARGIQFHETRDPYHDERLNAQIVQRLLDNLDKLPCAIEESLVLALPQPYQGECRRELAARYGELAAPIPAISEHGAAVVSAAELMKDTGVALADLALSFDGNHILTHKRTTATRALGELDDVIGVATSLKARISNALGLQPHLSKAG